MGHQHDGDELDDLQLGARDRRDEDAQAHRAEGQEHDDQEGHERAARGRGCRGRPKRRAGVRPEGTSMLPRTQVMMSATWSMAKRPKPMR